MQKKGLRTEKIINNTGLSWIETGSQKLIAQKSIAQNSISDVVNFFF
ncbi:MAG TPA: hypothetical protein VFQ86_08575 [Arachidicoccus soli]|nr:hypothetical protein [Arachidicoccus soli]